MPQLLVERSSLGSEAITELATPPLSARLVGEQVNEFTTRTFPMLFAHQAASVPQKLAVICETGTLTFAQLNARANQLARHLREVGLGRESIVGICIDRSLDMAVGILGILKAGAAYLPLDPEYPVERLAFMMDDARPSAVVTKSNLADVISRAETQLVLLDHDWPIISRQSSADLDDQPRPQDLAYVIYTSGSTGQPKGVMIEHGNLANYLLALNHELNITRDDVYLHLASIAFSSSRRQLMLPLSQGAAVAIATSTERQDALALFAMIKRRGVSVMDGVPSAWRNFTSILSGLEQNERDALLDNDLRLMLSASEPLNAEIPRIWSTEFRHHARHVHMFGQTETAGIVAVYHLPPEIPKGMKVVPVGRPIANTEICILDEEGQPCLPGVAGELHIGGAGVGRGYLNRPEMTAEKFVTHPFAEGARFYRTGDWARLNSDGLIEFAGRRDQQVKLRGFRIELAEIEAVLARHPSVRECAVVARETELGKRLIAYYVAAGSTPDAPDLRNFAMSQLPDYSVPSVFMQIEALPLSANGKVNRLALPDPEYKRPTVSSQYRAPRSDVERGLAQIWCQVLRLDRVGIDDNFFELGGHSLLAAQVIARVRRDFKKDVSIRVLFEGPTVAQMASSVDSAMSSTGAFLESIKPAQRNGKAPLSFTQQQFWLLDQAESRNSSYNVRTAIEIFGVLDIQRLTRALQAIVDRHEILRTNFVTIDGNPTQVISPKIQVSITCSDYTGAPANEKQLEMELAFDAEATQAFDLTSGPLFRFKLLSLEPDRQVLLITVHHIICDAWSMDLLLSELASLYQAQSVDPESLPRLTIQYADFAIWQRRLIEDARLQSQFDYWKQQLAGAPPVLDLPTDYPRPERLSGGGAELSMFLSGATSNAIKEFSSQENVTLFMTLLAAFQTLLFRYSGQSDIVVGSPVAGRSMLETEALIGSFVNTLALRGNLSDNPTFREFLARVRNTTLEAFANQAVPFEKLIEELNPERNTNRTPLFQVMFAFENAPAKHLAIDGLSLTPLRLDTVSSKFDLTLEVREEANGLRISFEYNTDLFAAATIERMLGHFENLLTSAVTDSTRRVSELPFMSESERHRLLEEANNTRADFPAEACIHHLFEAQVARTPDAIAAEFDRAQLSYRELNRRANQLAHYLRKRNVGPDTLVGICVERNLEMLIGMLGVLKAGGAYVPLDPAYPRERIAFMISDASMQIIVTQTGLLKDIPARDLEFICLDDANQGIAREDDHNPDVEMSSRDLAYVIYTSGSTGNPKGVMIEHRSLVNFSEAATAAYEITSQDRILQFASICFDLSVEEIYPALTHGATVVLRTDSMIDSPRDFLRCCETWKLSILDLPTAYWHEITAALSEQQLAIPVSVRLLIIGGEKASPDRLAAWRHSVRDRVRLMNTYGPTETTVVATMFDLTSGDEIVPANHLPIGKPIANTRIYVLSDSLQPVPVGVAGELYIGGVGLARGYVNRDDLTSEKFVADPFSDEPDGRLYRTGDLVRYRADGNIEFLGRVDSQVKLRGFRIELEEIEQVLRSHQDVSECVVTLWEDKDGDKRLVAYLVPSPEAQIDVAGLRSHLKTSLPAYMMPAAFEVLTALPLMPNGKIDRRGLPDPQPRQFEETENFVAPRTPFEQLLAQVWCEVLKVPRVSVHENFFELGGHSLLAARVVSSVRTQMDVELSMIDVFQAPTIADLAELLSPRQKLNQSEDGLAAMLEELANLSDEEAQRLLERETSVNGVAA